MTRKDTLNLGLLPEIAHEIGAGGVHIGERDHVIGRIRVVVACLPEPIFLFGQVIEIHVGLVTDDYCRHGGSLVSMR